MNEFKRFHPIVNFFYFASVIGFSMFFMHPVCLLISLLSGIAYTLMLRGPSALRGIKIYLPLMLVTAAANPVFNHKGVTILAYLPSGNPLTLESIVYGIAAAAMLASVLCWFSCFNKIMTSDKLIYLFGRTVPSLSLVLSMVLRFVPRFGTQLKNVRNSQKCIGRDMSDGTLTDRIRSGIKILSIMLIWSFESSIDTADSMKSRGFGLHGRTAYSPYHFDQRDGITLTFILIFSTFVLNAAAGSGAMYFTYFPSMQGGEPSLYQTAVFIAYLLLCITPIIIEVWEAYRWKKSKSTI